MPTSAVGGGVQAACGRGGHVTGPKDGKSSDTNISDTGQSGVCTLPPIAH
ncbi:hypothetical protein [Pyxidicoccus xibeiensis]|nr:hypothetical protein [Pyxidicoccus xibeiensis]MCP3137760.1 hypothetical protein [Pyxidicoccus xibeiensis]